MPNFVYTEAKRALLAGEIDFATDDMRVLLVMTNTTADTEEDVTTIAGFTTLDEGDGSGYARESIGSGNAVAADNANDRGEWDASDIVFALLGTGSRNYQAAVIYQHNNGDTDHVPVAYIDDDFPFPGNGSNVLFTWNAEGLIQAT